MKQFIITTRLDDVLHCFGFGFVFFVSCTGMTINVSSVSYNGGLLPHTIPRISTGVLSEKN